MKKIVLFAAMAVTVGPLMAQNHINLDTYIGAQLATEDLNGTARYVGMGGAMESLGADISTIGTNPAGIGLFRKNQVSGTFGMLIQQDGKTFQDGSKTSASFDQIGIVFTTRAGMHSYVNFGFNFHKSRNFNQILSVYDKLCDERELPNGDIEYYNFKGSQNRQTTIKAINGDLDTYWGESQVDHLYLGLLEEKDGSVSTIDAIDYDFIRAHTGYIGEYDFNISGNINNQVYLGLTVGVKDVHYDAYSEYFEHLSSLTMPNLKSVLMSDDHRITGQGFDIKAGAIFRPIEESPFRFGVSVSTPTWYKLTTRNTARIGNVEQIGYDADFRFYTPWKFGLSLGHTVENFLALGASYEFADYSTCDMRSITDYGYDWDGYYHENSSSDREMKRLTQNTLRGVSTLKLGAELKVAPTVALRLGYNYVSPMYKENAVRDQTINSPGTYMASTTDYTNWKATNRLTAGVGFTIDKLRLDLAYQYSMRSGDFYPYMNGLEAKYYDSEDHVQVLRNKCSAVNVKDNRHQLQCTLSYSF